MLPSFESSGFRSIFNSLAGKSMSKQFGVLKPYLSVVIPAYNEAAALKVLLPEMQQALAKDFPGQFELIVVDDASTDDTSAVLARCEMPVVLFRHDKQRGSGASRKTGSRQAQGELCAWIDGDGTYGVEDLLALVAHIEGYDQVIGMRRTEFGPWLWLRWLVKCMSAKVAAVLWARPIPDLNSGLRVFRRDCLQVWLDELPDGFSCTSTATLAALNHGQRIRFHPITYHPRAVGTHSKFHPVKDTWRLWMTIARLRWNRRKNLSQH
jgi:glycosyltransferase involved in cell wall biosynthesis